MDVEHVEGPSSRPPSQMGGTRLLHSRTKTAGCVLNGALPDPACTPGAVFRRATRKLVCRSGYSSKVRHVTDSTRGRVFFTAGRELDRYVVWDYVARRKSIIA